ncbi:hypothetical protein DFA_04053 [Cavenderia fasciculata]|uniref:NAD(P)H-hydrate epimerase n=1 Tax=Cavenderia fasciculata TaxID=261658 RepID=F4Q158_CACFS|nr:uncharacterized protein DFA_04053 [Cavenderia fasciculata]EGG18559.1 hypothetical protein DFA_04053 [Cavenderia fasciculata]|eukprot:XP_004366463.1 hypothetical protein DFA_04053 [Cavenderia fasciculata]
MTSLIKYLNQAESIKVDDLLLGPIYGFSTDQLMELAGLAASCSVMKSYPPSRLANKKVLAICGPGNNGGDGLVAARHLVLFGYQVDVYYPKRTDKDLYKRLVLQAEKTGVGFIDHFPKETIKSQYGLVIDAIFGYSFKGDIRPPFKDIIADLTTSQVPIASIDIPSGWDIEKGNIHNTFEPDMLVSLTSPKLCSREYRGKHWLGGRFMPPQLCQEMELNLPTFPDCEQVVDISLPSSPTL